MEYEEYRKNVLKNTNATMFARDSYSSRITTNTELFKSSEYKPFQSKYAFNPDLDTSEGLYKLAHQAGLGQDADRVIQRAGGENMQFFSGGFVSDVLDVLNMSSYGVVGLLKGKSFIEGVQNRESFSDEDSLGQYGFAGKIAGFAADIVTDPLTYIAPWKQVAKIPAVARTLQKATKMSVGEFQKIRIGEKEVKLRVGGWTPLNLLANKIVYGFAMDKTYLDGVQQIIDSSGVKIAEAEQLMSVFNKIDPKAADKVLEWKTDGSLGRRDLGDVQRIVGTEITPEQFQSVQSLYKMIDDNADRLVELGVLSKETRERYASDYLRQVYDDYLIAKHNTPGKKKAGVGIDYKSRKELTEQARKEMKIVENSSVVLGATVLKQIDQIKKAELQDFLSKNVAVTGEELAGSLARMEDFVQVPDAPAYKIDRNIDLKTSLKGVNDQLKKLLKERRKAVADNKQLVAEIGRMEKQLNALNNITEKNLSIAISGYRTILKEAGLSEGARKKVPTSAGQKVLADAVRKFLNQGRKSERLAREALSNEDLFREFLQTKEGLALERAFEDPRMMYQWQSPIEFFDAIRYPDKSKIVREPVEEIVEISEEEAMRRIKRAEVAQRMFGKVEQAKEVLKDTNLKLVSDAVDKLEDDYADLLFQKRLILDSMNVNEAGNLAGKYLPKEVWEMVKGTYNPKKEFGEEAVLLFKHAKVIWNPASYPRNFISAMVQNWWKMGLGPWRPDVYLDAHKELKTGGEMLQRMKKLGFHENTGAINELTDNYIQDKVIGEAIERTTGTPRAKVKQQLKHWDRWATNAYGHIDNIAKVAAFKHGVKKGMSDEDALKAAYAATFNYSHVTPFVHSMRRAIWGVPFVTFSLKAVPLVVDTLKNNPQRISVIGKARNALFQAAGVEGEQEAEVMPAWMRDNAIMLRLPWKDSEGRSMYFDLTYIMPFGSIVTGEYLRNPESANPVLQTIKELSQNKTFTGYKIFNESDDMDTVLSDIFIHVSKLALPPAVIGQLPQGYDEKGNRIMGPLTNRVMGEELGANERTVYQEAFRNIGLTVQPFDLESRERQFDYTRKKELQQLLVQNNILEQFSVPYMSDDETNPMNQPVEPIYDRDVRPLGR